MTHKFLLFLHKPCSNDDFIIVYTESRIFVGMASLDDGQPPLSAAGDPNISVRSLTASCVMCRSFSSIKGVISCSISRIMSTVTSLKQKTQRVAYISYLEHNAPLIIHKLSDLRFPIRWKWNFTMPSITMDCSKGRYLQWVTKNYALHAT